MRWSRESSGACFSGVCNESDEKSCENQFIFIYVFILASHNYSLKYIFLVSNSNKAFSENNHQKGVWSIFCFLYRMQGYRSSFVQLYYTGKAQKTQQK